MNNPVPLQNGNQLNLNQQPGNTPDMTGAIGDWLQNMTFEVVTKSVVNFNLKETINTFSFMGIWEVQSPQALMMRPIGQRGWKFFNVWSTIEIPLNPDDVIIYLGVQYRVMAVNGWGLYGYFSYELTLDYNGEGPPTP